MEVIWLKEPVVYLTPGTRYGRYGRFAAHREAVRLDVHVMHYVGGSEKSRKDILLRVLGEGQNYFWTCAYAYVYAQQVGDCLLCGWLPTDRPVLLTGGAGVLAFRDIFNWGLHKWQQAFPTNMYEHLDDCFWGSEPVPPVSLLWELL
jgi:hypothetical protein